MTRFDNRSHDKSAKPSRRRILKATGAIAAGLAAPTFLRIGSALAAYPDRPIKIVVANTPGGPSDISARMMAAEMQQVIGGSVFVENKGGAGGNIGYGFVARSEPDGYTILLTTSAYVVNPSLYNSIPYDPFKDFVGDLRAGGDAARVRGEVGPSGEKHEGVRRAGEGEPGQVQRLDAADRHHAAAPGRGAEAARGPAEDGDRGVPRRRRRGQGGARRHRAVELRHAGARAAANPGRHRCGRWRSTGEKRFVGLPDVPTMGEQGYKDFVFDTYCALMAPAKVPHEIVARLEKVCLDILAKDDFKKKLVSAGFDVTAKDGKGHAARIAKEIPMFKKIIEDAGITKL